MHVGLRAHAAKLRPAITIVKAQINHFPTATDFAATLAEDALLILDPLSHASDVDGITLTASIVDGSSHGELVKAADGSPFKGKP